MSAATKLETLYQCMKDAQKECGAKPCRMLLEMFLLKYINQVGITDYFVGKLYRQTLPFREKFLFYGENKYNKLLSKLSPPNRQGITSNKLVEKCLFEKAGIPTPPFIGLLHPEKGFDADGKPLHTLKDLQALLLSKRLDTCLIKPVDSYGGYGIRFFHTGGIPENGNTPAADWYISAASTLEDSKFYRSWGYVCEERAVQHEKLDALNPNALNTLRIWVSKKPEFRILGAFLRVSGGSIPVDNVSAGGMFARVDLDTGGIREPAVYQRLPIQSVDRHPMTGADITGLTIPFWEEAKSLVRRACFFYIGLNLLAFDIAIGPDGPLCIESNVGDHRGQFKIRVAFGSLL